MSVSAIILAAGKSTRMKSRLPKVLHEICGRPMLDYVLRACREAGCQRVMVVVGHGKEQVKAEFADDKHIDWIEQTEQHGTGHAARMCEGQIRKHDGDVLILAGDGPLVRGEVLKKLHLAHREEHAAGSMATAIVQNPAGYGRIVRGDDGRFVGIVEEIDATAEQRRIKEIFPSYYCVRSEDLLWALGKLEPNNRKKEYYLTDIFAHMRSSERKVVAVQAVAEEEVLGVNTRQQLAEADQIMQRRIHSRLREAGATIVSSASTYIEDGANVEQDTIIHPFTFVGRDARIGPDCVIGPYAMVPRQSIVAAGASVLGNVRDDSPVENAQG